MKVVERMGLKQRSKYEDVVAWLQSDPPGVPYPKNREALFMMESHLCSQLSAVLATTSGADEIYRRRGQARLARRELREVQELRELREVLGRREGVGVPLVGRGSGDCKVTVVRRDLQDPLALSLAHL